MWTDYNNLDIVFLVLAHLTSMIMLSFIFIRPFRVVCELLPFEENGRIRVVNGASLLISALLSLLPVTYVSIFVIVAANWQINRENRAGRLRDKIFGTMFIICTSLISTSEYTDMYTIHSIISDKPRLASLLLLSIKYVNYRIRTEGF